MLLANLEKLCLQQCCAKRYLLSCQPGLFVCLPGSLSGALVNLEVVIRSVVDDEDRLWWQMRNQFLLDPLEEVVPIYLIVVVSSTWFSSSFPLLRNPAFEPACKTISLSPLENGTCILKLLSLHHI